MHLVERLWAAHHQVAPYPDGVLPVPEPIVGTSFFPGGFGLWRPNIDAPLPRFPIGGVMILGHDFHSEVGYEKSLARGAESMTQPTWRNLLHLMARCGLEPGDCFFTNVYMGLRAGRETTGVFPGASDAAFVGRCLRFLTEQIATQRPRAILTLGRFVPALLARLSPELEGWRSTKTLKAIDDVGPLARVVTFDGVHDVVCVVAALTHPSLRHAGVRWRRYEGLVGDAAEVLMVIRNVAG